MYDPNVIKKMIEILERPGIEFLASTTYCRDKHNRITVMWKYPPSSDCHPVKFNWAGLVEQAVGELYPPFDAGRHVWYTERTKDLLETFGRPHWWYGEYPDNKPTKDVVLKILRNIIEKGVQVDD